MRVETENRQKHINFFEDLCDPTLRQAVADIQKSVPKRISTRESLRLREQMIGPDSQEAQEAKDKLVSWCVPTLAKALDPFWNGRFGLSDGDLFLHGFGHACQLVDNWLGANQLSQAVGKDRLQGGLTTYVCRRNGLPGAKNIDFIRFFWDCTRSFSQKEGGIPSAEIIEREMRILNEEENLGFSFYPHGWERRIFKIHDHIFQGSGLADLAGDDFIGSFESEVLQGCVHENLLARVDSLSPEIRKALTLWAEDGFEGVYKVMGGKNSYRQARKLIDKGLRILRHPQNSQKYR